MTTISVKFTARELALLCSLASDQLFRREFIDIRMAGYGPNADDLKLAKQLLERLRSASGRGLKIPPSGKNGVTQ